MKRVGVRTLRKMCVVELHPAGVAVHSDGEWARRGAGEREGHGGCAGQGRGGAEAGLGRQEGGSGRRAELGDAAGQGTGA